MAGYDPTNNRPYRIDDGPLTGNAYGRQIWQYVTGDVAAVVAGAGYFTDGQDLGIRVNDLVIVHDTTTPLITAHQVLSKSSTTRAVTLSGGTTIGAAA